MIEHRQSAPKADALPGCATPRTAEALRFPAFAAQALTAIRGNTRQNMAGTVSTTPGIVPNRVPALVGKLAALAIILLFTGPLTTWLGVKVWRVLKGRG